MIKNDRQYKITKAQAEKMERALLELQDSKPSDAIHPAIYTAQKDALKSQLDELIMQLKEYDDIKSGRRAIVEYETLRELPLALIQGRIAAGLSQRDLGALISVKEQQIQRYEANEYANASFERIQNIANALGVEVKEKVFLPSLKLSLKTLFRRLHDAGIDQEFLLKRIVSPTLRSKLESGFSDNEEKSIAIQIGGYVERVFGWSVPELIGSERSLTHSTAPMWLARFKTSSHAEERRLTAYTVYAHTLALFVLDATEELNKEIPTDPKIIRRSILDKYGLVTFQTVLSYVWDLGIPVLPLHDPGAFHGACWRVDGRNIIVLKQMNVSPSRWLYDLLHELYHAGKDQEETERSIVEESPIDPARQDSDEETEANYFAEDVMLDSKSDELEELCVLEAQGKIERLKAAVPIIAAKEGVEIDALANHMAFRLSTQGINWWGTANNLQPSGPPPWEYAARVLLENIHILNIGDFDREMLIRALSTE